MAAKLLTSDERSVLSWELARLYRAGLSWADSAALLEQEAATPALKAVFSALSGQFAQGLPLDRAMEATGAFPRYYLRLVTIGQVSGRLDQVLEALADYDKRESATAAALRQAVTYPMVMIALIGVIFFFLAWQILPVFSGVFAQLGIAGAGTGVRIALMAGSGVLTAAALGLLLWFRRKGAALCSGGRAGTAMARGRFASAMALMLKSGLPLDESMERTADLLSDSPLAGPMDQCRTAMAAGGDFAAAVSASGLLDPFHAGLLAAGFRGGDLPEAMEEVARRSGERAQEVLSAALSRFEYALVLFLCAAVAAVLLTVMLPLLRVLSALGG